VNGLVNNDLLGNLLKAYQAGQEGRKAQNTAEIARLHTEYYAAKDRRDAQAMVRIKHRIQDLGGRLAARTA
jgi:hypothetical protein